MPKKPEMTAGEWMRAHGLPWDASKPGKRKRTDPGPSSEEMRAMRAKVNKVKGAAKNETIKGFVEKRRHHVGCDCLFVPNAVKDRPAMVNFLDKNITAAKYMLLLTQGAPKHEGMVTRHLCGNGHLSCVNPAHLAWGTPSDNVSDMAKHRHAGDNTQDRINAIS